MLNFLQDKSEKKVEYIELIYDLIFVYLVSRNGALLQNIEDGFIPIMTGASYLASTLIILQIWSFHTLFINRYGCGSPTEYLGIFINMYLLYFMADGIRVDWGVRYYRYNLAWGLILLNLALQYFLRLRRYPCTSPWERKHMRTWILTLTAEAALVLVSIPVYLTTGYALGVWAMICGFAVPVLTYRTERMVPVDFPHLSERVMLYVVFTFGEMVLGIAGYFTGLVNGWTVYYSAMAFLVVAGLFTSYGTFYNHLLDREKTTAATGYMALHIVLILALNNITASLEFMREWKVLWVPKTIFMVVSLLIFFLCLLGTQHYAKTRVTGGKRFYWSMAGMFLAYCLVTALCYTRSYMSIAVTTLFIFLQLYALKKASKSIPAVQPEAPEACTDEETSSNSSLF